MSVQNPDITYDLYKVRSLAGKVAAALRASGQTYFGLVPIANGGSAVGLLLEEETGIPLIDAMRLRRYSDTDKTAMIDGARIVWGPDPQNIRNKRILLVDDVLDEGYSVVRGKQLLYNDYEASLVHVATLDYKLGPRKKHFPHLKPEYVGETHEDTPWIEYPWEKDGRTHEGELLMLVTMGYLKRDRVDRYLNLVREREAAVAAA